MFTLCFQGDSRPDHGDICLFFNERNEILLRAGVSRENHQACLPSHGDSLAKDFPPGLAFSAGSPLGAAGQALFIGLDATPVWLGGAPASRGEQEFTGTGWQWEPLRGFLQTAPDSLRAMGFRGLHLRNWLARYRFCPSCARALALSAHEMALSCPECRNDWYPGISPAMIVAITRNGGREILLARPKNRPHNWYSLIAGYCEAGESVEDTVHREVREEVDIAIKGLRYETSQGWPFSQSLMLGFTAEWADGEVRADPGELEEAAWFPVADMPFTPPPPTIAHTLIEAVRKRAGVAEGQ
jgi:NAD+ diphosphatase